MRAILIILSALGAALLVMSFLRSWQIRKAAKEGVSPETVGRNYSVGVVVAVVVFALGVIWLESDSASPDANYAPARLENGNVTGGGFGK